MSIAFVNKYVITSPAITWGNSFQSVTTSFSPTAGNLLVFLFMNTSNGHYPVAIQDSLNGSWTQATGVQSVKSGGFAAIDMWYVQNCASGSTTIQMALEANSAPGGDVELIVYEFSGVSTIAALLPGSGSNIQDSSPTAPIGPSLTPTTSGQLLMVLSVPLNINYTGISSPWTGDQSGQFTFSMTGYYINPPLSAQVADFVPNTAQAFISGGAIFQPPSTTLTLNLSDSVSSSDTMTDSFSVPLSDSSTVSDTAPNSFKVQSDARVPTTTPVVETLVSRLIPAQVKIYFNIEE